MLQIILINVIFYVSSLLFYENIIILGGHAHGPKPKSFYYSLPKKVRRMGLRTALSVRYAQVRFYNWTYFDIIILLTGYSF